MSHETIVAPDPGAEKARADAALFSIPVPRDYESWKNLAISFRAAGGDLETFLAWSASDPDNFDERTARRLFEHVSPDGAITERTLFKAARDAGWRDIGTYQAPAPPAPPAPVDLPPVAQVVKQIECLFEPGEYVNLCVRARQDARGKWTPADGGDNYERNQLLELLATSPRQVFAGYRAEAGAWFCANPTDGTGRGVAHTTAYRFALVESDELNRADQVRKILELNLPCATITDSGGKSVHALVRIDADGPNHYAERVARLHRICNQAGLRVDPANKDCSRLTRLAGVIRGNQHQRLLYVDTGARDFATWLRAHDPEPVELEPVEPGGLVLESLDEHTGENTPDADPAIIEGVLRERQIMMLTGPSKAGKSWTMMGLAYCVANGGRWLGRFDCVRTPVTYVDTELARNSLFRRAEDVRSALKLVDSGGNIKIISTMGLSVSATELADFIISNCARGLVIIDDFFCLEQGADENSGAEISSILHEFRRLCKAGFSVAFVHHHAKGAAGARAVIDRGAGSGFLARAVSAILDLCPLQLDEDARAEFDAAHPGAYPLRLSFVLREFADPGSMDVAFQHPLLVPLGPLEAAGAVEIGSAAANLKAANKGRKKASLAFWDSVDLRLGRAVNACTMAGRRPYKADVLEALNSDGGEEVSPRQLMRWTEPDAKTNWRRENGLLVCTDQTFYDPGPRAF